MMDCRECGTTKRRLLMHEVAIVQSLIAAAREALTASRRSGKIVCVRISVGRLSCASPDAVRMAFDVLSQGTDLDGAELQIETPPAMCRCRRCGAQTEVDDVFAPCPACGSCDVGFEGGRDLVLLSLDVEDPSLNNEEHEAEP